MNGTPQFRNAGVIGCGSIGASWAALFAAYGITTRVYDPQPAAESLLKTIVEEAVRALEKLGHFEKSATFEASLEEIFSRITFTTDLDTALDTAEIVQENGPENMTVKVLLLQRLDELLDPSVPILTSTSGLMCSSMQSALTRHPERFAVGHPFNPPHLIPLVEIVGGSLTSAQILHRAKSFYSHLDRRPVILNREVPGHIANRLQSALMREIIYLIKEDIATVTDVETAMQFGPGLRWGVMGPSELMHLGGGPGGVASYASKFLDPFLTWNSAGEGPLDECSRLKWVKQTVDAVGNESFLSMSRRRDAGIINTLKWRHSSLSNMTESDTVKQ